MTSAEPTAAPLPVAKAGPAPVRRRSGSSPARYKADISAGSLKLAESRIIADLLLQGVSAGSLRDAIVTQKNTRTLRLQAVHISERMRTESVIPLQGKVTARIEQLTSDIAKATSTSHRKKLQKEQDDLKKQQLELASFDERLNHYADMRIKLDLDDGVRGNYGKYGDLLAEVKAVTGGKDEE